MYRDIAKLVLYRNLGENSILMKLSGIFEDFDRGDCPNAELVARIYDQIKRLLDLATDYGFDTNLWHNYLAFILIQRFLDLREIKIKQLLEDLEIIFCKIINGSVIGTHFFTRHRE